MSEPQQEQAIARRFWAKVERGDLLECWQWKAARSGGTDGRSYGYFRMSSSQMVYAHRLAYQLQHGEIEPGAVIRHQCDNPLCCNPAHLLPGSQADNVQDMIDRGRLRKGEQIPSALLSARDIPAIRQRLQSGERHCAIAHDFGVSRSTITKIALGRSWAWA